MSGKNIILNSNIKKDGNNKKKLLWILIPIILFIIIIIIILCIILCKKPVIINKYKRNKKESYSFNKINTITLADAFLSSLSINNNATGNDPTLVDIVNKSQPINNSPVNEQQIYKPSLL